MTPGFAARSQTAYTPGDSVRRDMASVAVPAPASADTMHVTPAMIDSMIRNKPLEQFERKLEAVPFVPKGQWIVGVSVNYTQSSQNKYQFLVFENIKGDTYSIKVSPKVLFAFKNDMAAGLKFSYNRSLTKLESADIVLGSDASYDVDHLYSLAHNYYGTLLFRNYFSLGRTRRFGLFNEIQLELGGGQSKFTNGRGEALTGAYETNFSTNIGLVPGIVAFLSNYSAVEVNIGVLGFSYRHTKTIRDQIYVAHRKSQSANFRINLFSITFGATFYL